MTPPMIPMANQNGKRMLIDHRVPKYALRAPYVAALSEESPPNCLSRLLKKAQQLLQEKRAEILHSGGSLSKA